MEIELVLLTGFIALFDVRLLEVDITEFVLDCFSIVDCLFRFGPATTFLSITTNLASLGSDIYPFEGCVAFS